MKKCDTPHILHPFRRKVNVLVIDIGGAHVKLLATGQDAPRQFLSGPELTPEEIVARVVQAAARWDYEAVSLEECAVRCPMDRIAIHRKFCAFFPQTAFTRMGAAFVDLSFRVVRAVCDHSPVDVAASQNSNPNRR
jgi:hypothetical protein